jgi:hypothetical protein
MCTRFFALQVDVYKPVASKAHNSEVYIVGRGFRGIPSSVKEGLLQFVSTDVYEKAAMLPLSVMPESFLKSAKGCGQFFANRTRDAIEDIFAQRSMHPGQLRAVRDIQDHLANTWFQKFRITKLNPDLRLSPVRGIHMHMHERGIHTHSTWTPAERPHECVQPNSGAANESM